MVDQLQFYKQSIEIFLVKLIETFLCSQYAIFKMIERLPLRIIPCFHRPFDLVGFFTKGLYLLDNLNEGFNQKDYCGRSESSR